jgi:putative methyltransferase (TIGR04325 family)
MTRFEYWLLQKSPLVRVFRTPWFGRYPTYAAALAAIPPGLRVGYDQDQARELFSSVPIDKTRPTDYAMSFYLQKLLKPGSRVIDLGGNIGMLYYTARKLGALPESLTWTVCDVPQIIEAGRTVASREAAISSPLRFVSELPEAGSGDILVSSGTLQFLEPALPELLAQLPELPPAVMINRVPMWDAPQTVTLHDIHFCLAPYTIFNQGSLVAGMEKIGYRLADAWDCLESTFSLRFKPWIRLDRYRGMLFYKTPEQG